MRYTLLKAITEEIKVSDKVGTPVVEYLLRDNKKNEDIRVSRKEGYDLVKLYGATNVEPKTRVISCKEDKPDASGSIYYLKYTDGTKMNEHLMSMEEADKLYNPRDKWAFCKNDVVAIHSTGAGADEFSGICKHCHKPITLKTSPLYCEHCDGDCRW